MSSRAKSLDSLYPVQVSMPRSLLMFVLLIVIVAGALFALSRIDPSKAPQRVEKPVPENVLAK